jgi:hypothetical protein
MKLLFFTFVYVRSIDVNLIKSRDMYVCPDRPSTSFHVDHGILPQVYVVSTLPLLRKFNCGDNTWVVR